MLNKIVFGFSVVLSMILTVIILNTTGSDMTIGLMGLVASVCMIANAVYWLATDKL